MTFEEWAAALTAELRGAGFVVTDFNGFPMVEMPPTMADSVKLLKWVSVSLPHVKNIYAEGMLFTPERIHREG